VLHLDSANWPSCLVGMAQWGKLIDLLDSGHNINREFLHGTDFPLNSKSLQKCLVLASGSKETRTLTTRHTGVDAKNLNLM
jgi:hypothetical protein